MEHKPAPVQKPVKRRGVNHGDVRTLRAAGDVLSGKSKKGLFARLLPFLGPAFIASVAYVDPGNFATNIQGGAKFGYMLLWVIVASNLMAMLIQALSAKLGIATGQNLAEHCRNEFPRPVVLVMWVLMELVAMATDLAEFLGAALGFNLLFHIPLLAAALLTAVISVLVIWFSLHYVEQSYVIAEQSQDPGGLPYRFLLKALIPTGFALLLLQSIASALGSIEKLRKSNG